MFPGEIPGRSRLALLGRRRGGDRVFRNGRRRFVTKVNHFYNGPFGIGVATGVDHHLGRFIQHQLEKIDVCDPDASDLADAQFQVFRPFCGGPGIGHRFDHQPVRPRLVLPAGDGDIVISGRKVPFNQKRVVPG